MGDRPSHRRLREFVRYAGSTFCLGQHLQALRDHRQRVEIPGAVIGGVLTVGFALRVASLMELDRWVREGAFRKLLGERRPPLRDCLRDWAMRADVSRAWALNDAILATARRNKVFQGGSVHGWRVASLDGTEAWRTEARCCPACQVYHHRDGRVEYVHRMVPLQTVTRPEPGEPERGAPGRRAASGPPPLVWGMEGQRPGEGEVAAARRLLRQTVERRGHFCDVLTVDALYAEAPFLNEVRALGLHAVVRLTDERYEVVKDAAGLRRGRRCDSRFSTRIGSITLDVRLWDTPALTSWEGLREPVRVVYAEEELSWGEIQGNTSWECQALRILEVATTLSPAEATARVVWEIARARWGVENEGFRELKTQWHLDHGFLHHPTGMRVLWALLSAGFNLFQLFVARRIRRRTPLEETDRGVAERLRAELLVWEAPLDSYLFDTS